MGNVIIIGFGHKARQGKDYSAEYIGKIRENVKVIHFADKLYEECSNKLRKHPLVKLEGNIFSFLNNIEIKDGCAEVANYDQFHVNEMPQMKAIFDERGLTAYWGMDGKDSPFLQAWGTNYRREKCDANYWVNEGLKSIAECIVEHRTKRTGDLYILIGDVRFPNELSAISSLGGYYVDLVRLNLDGTRYLDPLRDQNHPSETGLDGYVFEYEVTAISGDLSSLEQQIYEIIEDIDQKVKDKRIYSLKLNQMILRASVGIKGDLCTAQEEIEKEAA